MTVRLDQPSGGITTVTIPAVPQALTTLADYASSANTARDCRGTNGSTGVMTTTSEDNVVDTPDKTVTAQGTVTSTEMVIGPADVILMIIDDDDAPAVTLALSAASISENGGAMVTATLYQPSIEATPEIISAMHRTPASSSDYTWSTNHHAHNCDGSNNGYR